MSLSLSIGLGLHRRGAAVAASAPSAFSPVGWDAQDAGTGGALAVTVSLLPASNGAAITGVDYTLNSGVTWTSSGGTGGFTISGLTNGNSYSVQIRAVNGAGAGPASDVKTAIPSVASPPVGTADFSTATQSGELVAIMDD